MSSTQNEPAVTVRSPRSEGERSMKENPRARDDYEYKKSLFYLPTEHIEGYMLRWENDDGTNLAAMEAIGYEFVKPAEVGLGGTKYTDRVYAYAGKDSQGNPMNAFLMKIRKDWWEEAQAKYQQQQRRAWDYSMAKNGSLEEVSSGLGSWALNDTKVKR